MCYSLTKLQRYIFGEKYRTSWNIWRRKTSPVPVRFNIKNSFCHYPADHITASPIIIKIMAWISPQCFGSGFRGILDPNPDPGSLIKINVNVKSPQNNCTFKNITCIFESTSFDGKILRSYDYAVLRNSLDPDSGVFRIRIFNEYGYEFRKTDFSSQDLCR